MNSKERKLLATIAAYGIINANTAVSLPATFTEKRLQELSGIGFGETPGLLESLENQGFVYSRDTGYYGYGDSHVEGEIVWKITAKGLVELWA